MFDRDGRPTIANLGIALLAIVVVLLIYVMLVPFDFVFKDDSGVVFTQRGASVLFIEGDAKDTTEGNVVYGEDAAAFYYFDGEESVEFSAPYSDIKMKMLGIAVKNLVTFRWDRECFVLEFNAK